MFLSGRSKMVGNFRMLCAGLLAGTMLTMAWGTGCGSFCFVARLASESGSARKAAKVGRPSLDLNVGQKTSLAETDLGHGGSLPASTDDPARLITNTYSATDIRDIITDVSIASKVTIIPDDSVKAQTVSIQFTSEPVDEVVRKLALLIGGYWKKREEGVYLLSMGNPSAPFFHEFAEAHVYRPKNQYGATIMSSLSPSYKDYVALDARTNAITITAPPELSKRILADIKQIDSPARQILVELLVTEVSATKNDDFGFSWSWKNFSLANDLTLNYATAAASDVATVKALIQQNKAKLRANPRVTAFEGRETSLSIGQDTYYSILSGNITFPTAQIQLIHTGVVLKFTGFIGDDGMITLDLEPEVSDAVVSVAGNPTTNVRKASTSIRVKSGQTIAIGGLVKENNTIMRTRIPFFGSLPLIGQFFTQHSTVDSKTDTIILITPTLGPDSMVGSH